MAGAGGCRSKKIFVGGKLEDEGNGPAKREEDNEETPCAKAALAGVELGAAHPQGACSDEGPWGKRRKASFSE